ncbi:hypothetical protein PIB30_057916 [Stylosanthes scabra]|uniref:RNase H type-1 domain-containing protein n=1 Tax=Stylosanthes scabra TaxID=79078 RepID=A0ABU6RJZ5_9FABA|nr:hypothetical protein [Stylosanthes scabra]
MQSVSVPLSLLVDWTPPLGCTVKINCDASVYNVSHMTGFGCVIRDANRTWIRGCFGTIPLCSVLRGELFAIWRGLTLAWECSCRDVTCETDSLHAFLEAQLHSKSEHAADVDLIVKIHESAVEKGIDYVELLKPLNDMHNVLQGVHHSSSLKS